MAMRITQPHFCPGVSLTDTFYRQKKDMAYPAWQAAYDSPYNSFAVSFHGQKHSLAAWLGLYLIRDITGVSTCVQGSNPQLP